MTYDADLADRIRDVIQAQDGVSEMRMFGGLAFLVHGHMAVAASGGGGLLLRCEPGETAVWVAEAGVTRFEMRGREMNGWLHVDTSAVETDADLARWVSVGVSYAASLPPK